MSALADCLCAQIESDGLPGVCFCGVVPGEAAAADYFGNCKGVCGMAWVRLSSMYPATSVGVADISIGNCNKELGLELEVGIMRCFVLSDERGNPPSAEAIKEATSLQVLDAECMVRAVACCDAISRRDFRLSLYQPLGPEGGVVGGIWSLSMI